VTTLDAYACAPDLPAEADALRALAARLDASPRTPAAVRPLALRKAAWLDRAALAAPGSERAVTLADTAARELVAHDRVFGTLAADPDDARGYVRAQYAAHHQDAEATR
jgi:hypothetical protein